MKLIVSLIKWLWWLGVSYIPIAINNLERQFMASIGCPLSGDCYVPGSEILIDFDILVIGLALYLWPICIWFLGGRYVFGGICSFVQNRLTHHSSGTCQSASLMSNLSHRRPNVFP